MGQLLHVSIPEDVNLRYEFAEELPLVEADPTQLRQVVMNLITNAVEAIGEDAGTVTLRTGAMDADQEALRHSYVNAQLEPGRYVSVEVTDTGCGMDEETQARLFDPFFTTKRAGRGLGMAAVLGIVHGHGGCVQVESAPGQGSRFRVLLPCEGRERRPASVPEAEPPSLEATPAGTVLVVDDDEAVRRLTAAMLEKNGFSVLTAADGEEAVAVFRERADEIAVVILDLAMPGLDGEEAAREVRAVRPQAPLVFTSGYSQYRADQPPETQSRTAFMQKPFTLEDLLEAIRRAAGARSPGPGA
jgi:CheY-like chemotaxis protein